MLRACVLDFAGSWDSKLHLMEFAYNNCFQATISTTLFEALYGRRMRINETRVSLSYQWDCRINETGVSLSYQWDCTKDHGKNVYSWSKED